ncbi:hypothetical protein EON63_16960 [archaeon]|nr:MAG: hypothetical protein EON63_16960 [archaeon]
MPVKVVSLAEYCQLSKVFHIETLKTCGSYWFSQLLSSVILLGSLAVKIPQILNIVTSGNVIGISPEAFYTEVPMTINTVMYNYRNNYPFMSYGENIFVLIQNLLLVGILWHYMTPKPSFFTVFIVLALFSFVTVVGMYIPIEYVYLLPNTNLPLLIISRCAQVYRNFRARATGQLSSITTFLTFGGSVARVFTTITQVGWDWSLLSSFLIGGGLSGILLGQVRCMAHGV